MWFVEGSRESVKSGEVTRYAPEQDKNEFNQSKYNPDNAIINPSPEY